MVGCPEEGVGAVVVGGDYLGLGIARSVGRQGRAVCIIDDEWSIARHSRFTTHALKVRDLRDEGAALDALLRAAEILPLHGWVLIPTRDELVEVVAKNAEVLGATYRLTTPAWDTTRWACDKRLTYELALELAIPTPKTWYSCSEDEFDADDFAFPVVVKPAVKHRFIYATKAKAWRADAPRDLRALFRRADSIVRPGEVMIQEFVPGDGRQQYAYCALITNGRVAADMCVRRLRQHPREFGRASTFVETIDEPDIVRPSQRFLQARDFDGLVEIEYKRDPRDREYKLLDVNARTWGYHTLGAAAGVDFAALLFAAACGETVSTSRARAGVSWVRLVTDIPMAVGEIAARRLSLRRYVASVADADTEAVFSRADPKPALVEMVLLPYLYWKRGF
jgi:D-aspartate ligase